MMPGHAHGLRQPELRHQVISWPKNGSGNHQWLPGRSHHQTQRLPVAARSHFTPITSTTWENGGMIRTVSVWHGKDGYILCVTDKKAWRMAEEWLAVTMCKMSRGYLCPLCLCNRWPWTFAVGWGRDDDGCRTHSLGSFLFHLGQRSDLTGSREVYECPLTFGEVCERFPGSRIDGDDDGVHWAKGVLLPVVQEEHGKYGVIS